MHHIDLESPPLLAQRPSNARTASGFAWGSGLRQRLRLAPLFLSLAIADRLGASRQRALHRSLPPWRAGISVVIPERGAPDLLTQALTSVRAAFAHVDEPTQIVIVANGAASGDYAAVAASFPEAEFIYSPEPLGFSSAICRGMRAVRHDWTFLLNNDMTLDPLALRELAEHRAPDVFAVASQIFQRSGDGRREETGFTDWYVDASGIQLFHADPGSGTGVREHLCASGGAALFRSAPLRKYSRDSRCYDPFYWEDVEWGVRARNDGMRVLFCPSSHAWHRHRATTSRFYAAAEIERIVARNRVLFDARNAITDHGAKWLMQRVCDLPYDSQHGLARLPVAAQVLRQRLRARRRPSSSVPPRLLPNKPVIELTPSYSFRLRYTGVGHRRPRVLMVTPFCVFPPSHGGARRIDGLLRHLRRDYDVVLVSDEATLYDPRSFVYFDGLHAVHLVQRPREENTGAIAGLGARIRTHCHETLGSVVSGALREYQPDIVQIEHVELAGLSRYRSPGQRWILGLHDAFDARDFSDPRASARLEQHLRETFDAVTVCSAEDVRMVDHPRTVCIPNGADIGRYVTASQGARMLFMGPFRYAQNLDGIRSFLRTAYPAVIAAVPDASVRILGGSGARAATAGDAAFAQPSVTVMEHRDDVDDQLAECALTLNPLTGIRGSSIKVIESLAAGRVCVSTEEGARGFLDADLPGLIATKDTDGMIAPIVDLLRDAERRHRLEAPSSAAMGTLGWEPIAQSQSDLYRHLLGTGHA